MKSLAEGVTGQCSSRGPRPRPVVRSARPSLLSVILNAFMVPFMPMVFVEALLALQSCLVPTVLEKFCIRIGFVQNNANPRSTHFVLCARSLGMRSPSQSTTGQGGRDGRCSKGSKHGSSSGTNLCPREEVSVERPSGQGHLFGPMLVS